jgi:hypothetical protein
MRLVARWSLSLAVLMATLATSPLLAPATVHAQPCNLAEGFDNIITLPGAGWFTQNNSSPVGSTGWFQGNPNVLPAQAGATNSYIGANFNNTTGTNTISNWLLTPQLQLDNGAQLTFYTRNPADNPFPDRLEVRLSTSGSSTNVGASSTSVGDFTTLLVSVNPNLTVGGYPEVWTQFTVTLSGLGGPTTGRLAFRYFVTQGGPTGDNSNYIGIDTFQYTCTGSGPGTSTPTPTVTLSSVANQLISNPTSCVNAGDGGTPWTNVAGALAPGGGMAQTTPVGFASQSLQCTGYLFPGLPADAQIIGIEVLAQRLASFDLQARDGTVRLVKQGSAIPASRGGTYIPSSLTVQGFGGTADTWGESWTGADVQGPDFGVLYNIRRTSTQSVTVSLDSLRVRITWIPGPTATPTSTAGPSSTPTPSATPSLTGTATGTATETSTATASPSVTATGTVTSTPSTTSTVPPGATSTQSPTVTVTATGTPVAVLVNAGTCDQVDYLAGTAAWTNPNQAQSVNGAMATTDLTLSPSSHFASEYLRCTGYDLSAIPAGATITGIEVLVLRQEAGPTPNVAREASLKLLKGLTPVPTGTDQAAASGQPFIPTSLTERTYGSPTNLWGTTWTRAELQSGSGFGVVYAVRRSGSTNPASVRVDALRVRITYTS